MEKPNDHIVEICNAQNLNILDLAQQARCFQDIVCNRDIAYANKLVARIFSLVDEQALSLRSYSVLINVIAKLFPAFDLAAVTRGLNDHFLLQGDIIRIFCRRLCSKNWRTCWQAAGGLHSISNLCLTLPIGNLRFLIKILGRVFSRPWRRTSETEGYMESLLIHGLQKDIRPQEKTYARLIPACGDEFIRNLFEKARGVSLHSHINSKKLIFCHADLYCSAILSGNTSIPGYNEALPYLLTNLHSGLPPPPQFDHHDPKSFALGILTRMANNQSFKLPTTRFFGDMSWAEDLIRCVVPLDPLNAPTEPMLSVLDLVFRAAKHYPQLFESAKTCPMSAVTAMWIRAQEPEFSHSNQIDDFFDFFYRLNTSQNFTRFCTFLKTGYTILIAPDIRPLLPNTPKHLRYPLIRRFLKALHPKEIDIDEETELKLVKSPNVVWSATIFLQLDPTHAVVLLKRLLNVQTTILSESHPVFRHYVEGTEAAAEALLFYLDPLDFEQGSQAVKSRQFKASKSREQRTRLEWANEAFVCAIGSRSLQIYRENLRWTRRFIKDPLTCASLLNASYISASETQELLVGFDKNATKEDIRKNVADGIFSETFEILADHVDILLAASKEPSFLRGNELSLPGVWELISGVVFRRLYIICRFRHELDFDQLISLILGPSFDFLIRCEEQLLNSSTGSGPWYLINGPLLLHKSFYVHDAPPLVRSLLDTYCRQRNKIWERHRNLGRENELELPIQCPRGLPLQKLLPEAVGITSTANMPYIQERVKQILELPLVDPQAADTVIIDGQSNHKQIWVDSYFEAVRIHFKDVPPDQRRSQARAFWNQCRVRPLYGRALTELELRHWGDMFGKLVDENFEPPKSKTYMSISGVENGTEWSPYFGTKPKSPKLNYQVTLLLSSLEINASHHVFAYDRMRKITDTHEPHTIYDSLLDDLKHLPSNANVRNAYVMSGLLYLDQKHKTGDRIFQHPFPSYGSQRMPAVFLDDEILDKLPNNLGTDEILEKLKKDVPSFLLVQLLERNRRAMEPDALPVGPGLNFLTLLTFLKESDTPHLAIPYISDIVLDKPQLSSWVREYLTPGFLARLDPSAAYKMLQDLQDQLLDRLEKQQAEQKLIDKHKKSNPQRQIVKISTLKHLSVLNTSGIMSYQHSLKLLSRIIESSQHPDVLFSAANAILDLSTGLEKDAGLIIEPMKLLIPRVASPEERLYASGEMLEVEQINELPLTFESFSALDSGMKTLEKCLFQAASQSIPDFVKQDYVNAILLPIVDLSIRQHGLWLQNFIKLCGKMECSSLAHDVATHLPTCPFNEDIILHLVEYWHPFIGNNHIHLLTNLHLNYASYEYFVPVDEIMQQDAKLMNSDAGKHWNSVRKQQLKLRPFHENMRVMFNQGAIATLLPITLEHCRFHLDHGGLQGYKRLENLLSDVERLMEHVHAVDRKRNPHNHNEKFDYLRALVQMIEERRTPDWQQNPHRQPPKLPKTVRWRLKLMKWPTSEHDDPDVFRALVSELRALLSETLSTRLLFDEEAGVLEEELKGRTLKAGTCEKMALALGDIKQPRNAVDLMFIRKAQKLLHRAIHSFSESGRSGEDYIFFDPSVPKAFRSLAEGWNKSDIEQVRDVAFEIMDTLDRSSAEP